VTARIVDGALGVTDANGSPVGFDPLEEPIGDWLIVGVVALVAGGQLGSIALCGLGQTLWLERTSELQCLDSIRGDCCGLGTIDGEQCAIDYGDKLV
jgi:hypothetical protein